MDELTRQEKIAKLKGFVLRIGELSELSKQLMAEDEGIDADIDDFNSRLDTEIFLRENGRESESILDGEQAKSEAASLQLRKLDVNKRIEDVNAEITWLEEQIAAIKVS